MNSSRNSFKDSLRNLFPYPFRNSCKDPFKYFSKECFGIFFSKKSYMTSSKCSKWVFLRKYLQKLLQNLFRNFINGSYKKFSNNLFSQSLKVSFNVLCKDSFGFFFFTLEVSQRPDSEIPLQSP